VGTDLAKVLRRAERPVPYRIDDLGRVLVTGARGSVGRAMVDRLVGTQVLATDLDSLDVRDAEAVRRCMVTWEPEVVFHLAGAKHAPHGEDDPFGVVETNVTGTRNVLRYAPRGSRVVMASTCKACNPETAYGASKLVAERMVLNAGGVVVRYYNVVETQGNVFELWESIPPDDPIPVTSCCRFFVSLREAVALTLAAAALPPGRYTVDPGERTWMPNVATRLYGSERKQVEIAPRRGDRLVEPRKGSHERLLSLEPPLQRIVSPHDGRENDSSTITSEQKEAEGGS